MRRLVVAGVNVSESDSESDSDPEPPKEKAKESKTSSDNILDMMKIFMNNLGS